MEGVLIDCMWIRLEMEGREVFSSTESAAKRTHAKDSERTVGRKGRDELSRSSNREDPMGWPFLVHLSRLPSYQSAIGTGCPAVSPMISRPQLVP